MNAKVFARRVTSIVLFLLILGGVYLGFAPTMAVAEGGGSDPIMNDSTITAPPAPEANAGNLDFWTTFTVFCAVL